MDSISQIMSPLSETPANSGGPIVIANIGTLAIRGFASLNAAQLQESFLGELIHLLESAPPESTDWSGLHTNKAPRLTVKFTAQPTPQALGRQIARALFNLLVLERRRQNE